MLHSHIHVHAGHNIHVHTDTMQDTHIHVHTDTCRTHIYMFILTQWITDARRKTSLTNICTSHFIARVRKGYSRLACERELEIEHNCNILTPTFMAVNVVSFSFSWCSTGGPGVHSTGCWLSLLHLISIFSGPQLIRAPRPFGLVRLSLPHLVYNSTPTVCNSNGTWLPSWLRYIIIQRPHDRPLDLWNRMFNRHQAEIIQTQTRIRSRD